MSAFACLVSSRDEDPSMEWLRRQAWLRALLNGVTRRHYGGPDAPSVLHPAPPSLPVPEDLRRAIDEEGPGTSDND